MDFKEALLTIMAYRNWVNSVDYNKQTALGWDTVVWDAVDALAPGWLEYEDIPRTWVYDASKG